MFEEGAALAAMGITLCPGAHAVKLLFWYAEPQLSYSLLSNPRFCLKLPCWMKKDFSCVMYERMKKKYRVFE